MKLSILPVVLTCGFLSAFSAVAQDPLPSWNNTAPKKAIIEVAG